MQCIDNGCKPLDQLQIAIPEFIKSPGLLVEYCEDGIRRLASINDGGQGVVAKILSGAFGVLVQGGIKEGFEVGGSGGCMRC